MTHLEAIASLGRSTIGASIYKNKSSSDGIGCAAAPVTSLSCWPRSPPAAQCDTFRSIPFSERRLGVVVAMVVLVSVMAFTFLLFCGDLRRIENGRLLPRQGRFTFALLLPPPTRARPFLPKKENNCRRTN